MAATYSFQDKCDRAIEHLASLDAEVRRWIDTTPYRVTDEPDPNPIRHPVLGWPDARPRRYRVAAVEPIPPRFSIVIDDCIQNLRSALDHLALALATAHTPAMTPEQVRGCEFPVFGERMMEPGEETKRIGCIRPDARTAIKALQPYQRGGRGYTLDPLWRIHELNRVDKHQRLVLCAVRIGDYGVGFTKRDDENIRDVPFARVSSFQELVLDGLLMQYVAIPQDPKRDVKLEPTVDPRVAFGIGSPAEHEAVLPVLGRLCEYVRDSVIVPLSAFL